MLTPFSKHRTICDPVISSNTKGSIMGRILSKSFIKNGPAEWIQSDRSVPEFKIAKSALVAATYNFEKNVNIIKLNSCQKILNFLEVKIDIKLTLCQTH